MLTPSLNLTLTFGTFIQLESCDLLSIWETMLDLLLENSKQHSSGSFLHEKKRQNINYVSIKSLSKINQAPKDEAMINPSILLSKSRACWLVSQI